MDKKQGCCDCQYKTADLQGGFMCQENYEGADTISQLKLKAELVERAYEIQQADKYTLLIQSERLMHDLSKVKDDLLRCNEYIQTLEENNREIISAKKILTLQLSAAREDFSAELSKKYSGEDKVYSLKKELDKCLERERKYKDEIRDLKDNINLMNRDLIRV